MINFTSMKSKEATFKRFIYYRVTLKKCPTHNKQALISVTRMEYKVIGYCCAKFKKSIESLCCKYKYGILSGRYNFSPKKRLR